MRHARSRPESGRPPHEWDLDPAGRAALQRLRDSAILPTGARWYSSPERKAVDTARALTSSHVEVRAGLREHERHSTHWFEDPADFRAAVARAFEQPAHPAVPGWEPLAATRSRLLTAVRHILGEHPGDVVLVGHGTAWTLLRAELTGRAPDLAAWSALRMPDVWVLAEPFAPDSLEA